MFFQFEIIHFSSSKQFFVVFWILRDSKTYLRPPSMIDNDVKKCFFIIKIVFLFKLDPVC